MTVAMADGALDETEGLVMKQWVRRILRTYEDSETEAMKSRLNYAMRSAHVQAKKKKLSRSNLTEQINKLNDTAGSIEAIELCYDVMTADGKLDPSEMKLIGQISSALDIEDDDIEKIRSLKLAKVKGNMIRGEGIEGILGADPTWPREKVCAHLVKEFQRWNSRVSTLPSGPEQENAQKMINMIAEARKKYAC
jgi:tellurite resistance protein